MEAIVIDNGKRSPFAILILLEHTLTRVRGVIELALGGSVEQFVTDAERITLKSNSFDDGTPRKYQVEAGNDAHGLWEAIKQTFEKNTTFNAIHVLSELIKTRFKSTTDPVLVRTYIDNHMKRLMQCKGFGTLDAEVINSLKCCILMEAMPSDLGGIQQSFWAIEKPTFEILYETLKRSYDAIQINNKGNTSQNNNAGKPGYNTSMSAFSTEQTNKSHGRDRGGYKGKNFDPNYHNRKTSSTSRSPSPAGTLKSCLSKGKNAISSYGGHSTEGGTVHFNACIAIVTPRPQPSPQLILQAPTLSTDINAAAYQNGTLISTEQQWIWDTGAVRHFTFANYIINERQLKEPIQVVCANRTTMYLKWFGDVELTPNFTLRNVLYMKGAGANLVAACMVHDAGFTVEELKMKVNVKYQGNLALVFTRAKGDSLYRFIRKSTTNVVDQLSNPKPMWKADADAASSSSSSALGSGPSLNDNGSEDEDEDKAECRRRDAQFAMKKRDAAAARKSGPTRTIKKKPAAAAKSKSRKSRSKSPGSRDDTDASDTDEPIMGTTPKSHAYSSNYTKAMALKAAATHARTARQATSDLRIVSEAAQVASQSGNLVYVPGDDHYVPPVPSNFDPPTVVRLATLATLNGNHQLPAAVFLNAIITSTTPIQVNATDESSGNQQAILWHQRLGHPSIKQLAEANKTYKLGITSKQLAYVDNQSCEHCIKGKSRRTSTTNSITPSLDRKETVYLPLDRLDMDLSGPMSMNQPDSKVKQRVRSLGGHLYYLLIVDRSTNYWWYYPLKTKDEASGYIVTLVRFLKTQYGKTVKRLHSDGGGEFINSRVISLCEELGIRQTYTTAYTPQLNTVETNNRILANTVRTMLSNASAPPQLWAEAGIHATYAHNLKPAATPNRPTTAPIELLNKKTPEIKRLHVWGGDSYVVLPKEHKGKLNFQTEDGIHLGVDEQQRCHRILHPTKLTISYSRDVKFDETSFKQIAKLGATQLNRTARATVIKDFVPFTHNSNLLSETNDSNSESTNNKHKPAPQASVHRNSVINEDCEELPYDCYDEFRREYFGENNAQAPYSGVTNNTQSLRHYSNSADEAIDLENEPPPLDRDGTTNGTDVSSQGINDTDTSSDEETISNHPPVDNGEASPASTRPSSPTIRTPERTTTVSTSASDTDDCESAATWCEDEEIWTEDESSVEQAIHHRPVRIKNPIERFYYAGYTKHQSRVPILGTNVMEVFEPRTYKEAMACVDHKFWLAACDKEYKALMDKKVWTLVRLPSGRKALNCGWVFKVKHDSEGNASQYKARCVVKGCGQIEGIDFNETYAPVARAKSIKLVL